MVTLIGNSYYFFRGGTENMATKKQNIYEKIMAARKEFMESNPTKTGYNKFQNFKYFELQDIVPLATKICCKLGLYTHINITDGVAKMTVLNTENPAEFVEYGLTAPTVKEDKFNNMLQDTGRAETYLRRYLYLLFLDITENDQVDGADQNSKEFKTAKQYKQRKQPAFKTANTHKPNESNVRKQAKEIIKALEFQEEQVNILNAKIQLMQFIRQGRVKEEDCDKILKELEVLLNGTGS